MCPSALIATPILIFITVLHKQHDTLLQISMTICPTFELPPSFSPLFTSDACFYRSRYPAHPSYFQFQNPRVPLPDTTPPPSPCLAFRATLPQLLSPSSGRGCTRLIYFFHSMAHNQQYFLLSYSVLFLFLFLPLHFFVFSFLCFI